MKNLAVARSRAFVKAVRRCRVEPELTCVLQVCILKLGIGSHSVCYCCSFKVSSLELTSSEQMMPNALCTLARSESL